MSDPAETVDDVANTRNYAPIRHTLSPELEAGERNPPNLLELRRNALASGARRAPRWEGRRIRCTAALDTQYPSGHSSVIADAWSAMLAFWAAVALVAALLWLAVPVDQSDAAAVTG